MAILVFTNARVEVDTVDLSDHVVSVEITYSADLLDATAMSTSSTRTRVVGLKDWRASVEFNQDYAASEVDATLFPLVGQTTSFSFKVRPVNTTISATNPEYNGSAFLESYQPVAGSVATVARTTVPFQGDGDLGRATA